MVCVQLAGDTDRRIGSQRGERHLSHQEVIASLVEAGHTLDQIEVDLAQQAPWLDDDERAALWLLAWSFEGSPRLIHSNGQRGDVVTGSGTLPMELTMYGA